MSSKQLRTLILVLFCFDIFKSEAQLQEGFYQSSCGFAEFIVKQEVRNGFIRDNGVAAGLVRLHFHDCFVRVRNYITIQSFFHALKYHKA